jgi:hypothetical protein
MTPIKRGRRRFLRDAAVGTCGALFGAGGLLAGRRQSTSEPDAPAIDRESAKDGRATVSHVLSLGALQRHARQAHSSRSRMPETLARLDGITRVHGWMLEGDDILLLGSREPALPALHLDDLAVVLRSAYQVTDTYHQAAGCSIDPRRGDEDPWSIQAVSVFGLPVDCSMAARFVAVDYELKQAAAGIVAIDTVPSMGELARRDIDLCAEAEPIATRPLERSHRLWFCAVYPASPRFALEEDCVFIERPVGVHVLTEEEFFDRRGTRVGAGPPDAMASQFVTAVSRLLASAARPSYAALVGDFRLIEAAKLLRKVRGGAKAIAYLLEEHPIAQVPVPRFVAGVRRDEQLDVACGGEVSEREKDGHRIIESRVTNRRHRSRFEGGVTADIELPENEPGRATSSETTALRRRILAARPTSATVAWAIPA